ncbi:DUF6879 family protein [Streptomyces sp. NPDC001941]|uniref:DUF6879 family protein n=1 Tax=Streptomyces sp. NPDC001941 TaxID=3154659 RepID=UPI00331F40F5
MARKFRMVGSNSGSNGCPTLYTIPDGRYVVQGPRVDDPEELAQLDRRAPGEGAVIVPRELLANFGPREAIHVPQMITFAEFDAMFANLKHSAWRLETRRRYASDETTPTYRQFVAGEPVDWTSWDAEWCAERREQTRLGKRFERVRILDTPPTVAQRYLLDNARRNSAVGEDIRVLDRSQAEELSLPHEDFWIFDARVVALLHFDEDDEMTGVELITNPVEVLPYLQAREAAWHYARPYDQA